MDTTEPTTHPQAEEAEHGKAPKGVVYLSGPMTGIAEFNYPAFRAAAGALRADGWEVYDPSSSGPGQVGTFDPTGLDGSETGSEFDMKAAFRDFTRHIIDEATHLAVLPGWESSGGARIEISLAMYLGLPIFDALTGAPVQPVFAAHDALALDASIARHPAGKAVADGAAETVAQTVTRLTPVQSPPTPTPTPGSSEVRVVSSTGGAKGTKEARFSLVPPGPLWELSVLYGRGGIKYAPGENWKRGYPWSLSYDALKRHLDLWWSREQDHDAEMGVKHLICVAWHAFNLAWFMENRPQFDDRPGAIGSEGEGETYEGALPTPQWLIDLAEEQRAEQEAAAVTASEAA